MEVSDLLAKARALPLPQRHRVAAIMGSLVADAAGKRTDTSGRRKTANSPRFTPARGYDSYSGAYPCLDLKS